MIKDIANVTMVNDDKIQSLSFCCCFMLWSIQASGKDSIQKESVIIYNPKHKLF